MPNFGYRIQDHNGESGYCEGLMMIELYICLACPSSTKFSPSNAAAEGKSFGLCVVLHRRRGPMHRSFRAHPMPASSPRLAMSLCNTFSAKGRPCLMRSSQGAQGTSCAHRAATLAGLKAGKTDHTASAENHRTASSQIAAAFITRSPEQA